MRTTTAGRAVRTARSYVGRSPHPEIIPAPAAHGRTGSLYFSCTGRGPVAAAQNGGGAAGARRPDYSVAERNPAPASRLIAGRDRNRAHFSPANGDGTQPDGTSCQFDFNILPATFLNNDVGFRCCADIAP